MTLDEMQNLRPGDLMSGNGTLLLTLSVDTMFSREVELLVQFCDDRKSKRLFIWHAGINSRVAATLTLVSRRCR